MDGSLDPFDPSSSAVQEKSRIKHIVTINGVSATLRTSFGGGSHYLSSDAEVSSLTEEDPDGSDDEDYIREPSKHRPNTRSKGMKQSKLPFSPKKLRSRRMQPQALSDSGDDLGGYVESDAEEEPIPARRSTRTSKSARLNLDDDPLDEGIEDIDDETYDQGLDKAKSDVGKKRKRRPATSRPAYGHFRDINDLEFDAYNEESTEPLRAHRDICEKCHKGPAHVLLKAAKKLKRGRHKKSPDADTDLEGGEEERIQSMGGWVRW